MRNAILTMTIIGLVMCKREASTEASFVLASELVSDIKEDRTFDYQKYFHEPHLIKQNGLDKSLDGLLETIELEYGDNPEFEYDKTKFHEDKNEVGVPYKFLYQIRGNDKRGKLEIFINPESQKIYSLKVFHDYN